MQPRQFKNVHNFGLLAFFLTACASVGSPAPACIIDADCNDSSMQCVFESNDAAQGYCTPKPASDGGPRTDGGRIDGGPRVDGGGTDGGGLDGGGTDGGGLDGGGTDG